MVHVKFVLVVVTPSHRAQDMQLTVVRDQCRSLLGSGDLMAGQSEAPRETHRLPPMPQIFFINVAVKPVCC